ncbi:hypothetical protein NL53_05900 [Vibrio variabilis]|uniref:HDOD domain-containing protein n=1 Tax=Vibrio variabilis TaxID=990271 RepID=A0ABR4YDV9_9VIBR|nr:hypothetical protein NL53_05900 [Vibrio variabilis]
MNYGDLLTPITSVSRFIENKSVNNQMCDLRKLFDDSDNLPSIPKVVRELISQLNHNDVSMEGLANTLSNDQNLSAKVLRVANSSYYQMSRKISSIQEAITIMGLKNLQNIVLTTGVTAAFANYQKHEISPFLITSFKTATLSFELAKHLKPKGFPIDENTCFIIGLLHNIGEVLIQVQTPEKGQLILCRVESGEQRKVVERDVLGISSNVLSAQLAKYWQLPEVVYETLAMDIEHHDIVSFYEDSSLASEEFASAVIVYISQHIAHHSNDMESESDILENELLSVMINQDIKELLERIGLKQLNVAAREIFE